MLTILGQYGNKTVTDIRIEGEAEACVTPRVKYRHDARTLASTLRENLPSGTFDRLVQEMLQFYLTDNQHFPEPLKSDILAIADAIDSKNRD
jgi:hypothetical protein